MTEQDRQPASSTSSHTPETPSEHPDAKDHGTSHVVRKEGLAGAVGTYVGGVTGAAAGAAAGALAGPGGMAVGAIVGAGLGAFGGKMAGDPVNAEIEKQNDPEKPGGEEGSGGGSHSV